MRPSKKQQLDSLMLRKAGEGNLKDNERVALLENAEPEVEGSPWKPDSPHRHTPEFVAWINSMTRGKFSDKLYYAPFEQYKQQSRAWLARRVDYLSLSAEERFDFHYQEFGRIIANTLYFADAYGWRRDEASATGEAKYYSDEHHAVVFFLLDCGYSFMTGKGRQIGLTTAMGLFDVKCMITQPNYFAKYICQDDDTGQEIFDQKIKFPYTKLPVWLRYPVSSHAMDNFRLGKKNKEGGFDYPNSRTMTIPPSNTAINGGTPSKVFVDEIGEIPMLSGMLFEGRPTLFKKDEDGKYVLSRQVLLYGTGGKMVRGKGAYRTEWYRQLSLWDSGDYASCIFPLFLSWDCKFSQAEYEQEKRAYYGGAKASAWNVSVEETKIQFHQHYPTVFEDMFASSAVMIVDRAFYDEGLKRCQEAPAGSLRYGSFQPVYDTTTKYGENSYLPFRVIGAEFVPSEDTENAPVTMKADVDRTFKNRYYQGTDPIQDQTGTSLFSSTILDAVDNSPICLLNFRKRFDPKAAFLQSMLMGIYYGTGKLNAAPELLEGNIGTAYIEFKQEYGYGLSLVFNTQLPLRFQGGPRTIGIDNHGHRSDMITADIGEYFRAFHQKIDIITYWNQIATFEQKSLSNGKTTWATKDHRYFQDDAIYSLDYAYICRSCFPYLEVESTVEERKATQARWMEIRQPDGTLIRRLTRK